jgi:molecular chaperone GrpE
MSEERHDAPAQEAGAKTKVKVVDRRRFRSDGEPVAAVAGSRVSQDGHAGEEAGISEEAAKGAVSGGERAAVAEDERDAQLAAQAARIDELSRAYAALVEDNKAFRQRLEREKARVVEAERASIAQALLEAADDLERAQAAIGSSDTEGLALKDLVDGVRLSLAALHKRIAELGAVRIAVAGKPFDPRVAEAVDTVAIADADQDGWVVQEIRAGYRVGDRVLRPARVRVGRVA